jgi:GT2 family glycosyltransferase
MEEITAVIINYNGGSLVLDSIESILNQQGVHVHVIVMDDGSEDGSPEVIKESFPNAEVYREEENTRHVNRLRNKGLSCAATEKVFLTDNDVLLDESCIAALLRVMEADDRIGTCIPRLMYLNEQCRIYQEGGSIHYVGTTVAPNRDTHVSNSESSPRIAVGGGIGLLDVEKVQQVGGFDEDYELAWGDDGELHQRMLLTGYKCKSVPSAVGFHEFESFSKARHYRARGQICNRWRFILSHYSGRTLLVIAPMLALYEFAQALYYLLKGIPLLYLKGTLDAIRQLPDILERRKRIQDLRVVPDREVLTAGPIYMRPSGGIEGKVVSAVVTALSLLFTGYWVLFRPLLPRGVSSRHVTEDTSGESEGGGASEVGRMGGN